MAWEELLQRPNAHREDVDPDPNVPEVGSSQEKAHLLTIPQRARRNHSLSGVGTYVLRDSLHHGLHMLRKTTSAASVACLCESRLGHGAGVLFIVVMRLDPERG